MHGGFLTWGVAGILMSSSIVSRKYGKTHTILWPNNSWDDINLSVVYIIFWSLILISSKAGHDFSMVFNFIAAETKKLEDNTTA